MFVLNHEGFEPFCAVGLELLVGQKRYVEWRGWFGYDELSFREDCFEFLDGASSLGFRHGVGLSVECVQLRAGDAMT